jgi:hypothetical protein
VTNPSKFDLSYQKLMPRSKIINLTPKPLFVCVVFLILSNYYEYEEGIEPSNSLKARKLLDLLIDCSLVSRNYAPWSYVLYSFPITRITKWYIPTE